MLSHDIMRRAHTVRLSATSRVRSPYDRRNLSRSASRALDVLEHFGLVQEPQRANEIAQALGLHPSSADQLLKTMVESAHLLFDARTKRYRPSARLAAFGAWIAKEYGGHQLRALLEELGERTGATITLSAQHDIHMQIIDMVKGNYGHDRTLRGMKVPLCGSAIGAALLATMDDAEMAMLLDRARISPAERLAIEVGIARVHAQGYAFGGMSEDDDIRSIALALPPTAAGVTMVVGLADQAQRISRGRDGLVATMREVMARHLPA